MLVDLVRHHLDLVAFLTFLLATGIYKLVQRWSGFEGRSIVGAVQAHRVRWMQNMAMRDNRVLDAVLLGSLSQGNAFFASSSAIAIGGSAALLGSGPRVEALLEQLPYTTRSAAGMFELKVLFLMAIFVYAFFKFAWAFRLSHYASIMIGSTPLLAADRTNEAECDLHARRTAKLIGIAAEHANGGLRAFYYAAAAIAWFFHPLAFMAVTALVLGILIRRDFYSRSRRILRGEWP